MRVVTTMLIMTRIMLPQKTAMVVQRGYAKDPIAEYVCERATVVHHDVVCIAKFGSVLLRYMPVDLLHPGHFYPDDCSC
jgi:hypothetical protein